MFEEMQSHVGIAKHKEQHKFYITEFKGDGHISRIFVVPVTSRKLKCTTQMSTLEGFYVANKKAEKKSAKKNNSFYGIKDFTPQLGKCGKLETIEYHNCEDLWEFYRLIDYCPWRGKFKHS